MDTRWRKFRYGTETCDPLWSFFGALICPECVVFLFALAGVRDDITYLAAGFWFLVFSVWCLIHLGKLMGNEKKHPIPVELLDGTWPDLILLIFLVFLLWNGMAIWRHFSYLIDDLFTYVWLLEDFIQRFFPLLFVTETIILCTVVLYLSVLRHWFLRKLRKKMFFYWLGTWVIGTIGRIRDRREADRLLRVQGGQAAKLLRNRLLWPLHLLGAVFLAGCLILAAVYWELEDIMVIIIPIGLLLYLLDLKIICSVSRDVGVLLGEIRQIAEDDDAMGEPELNTCSILRKSEEELLAIRDHKRESVEKRIQSERMKVDLITNVSHDLKTPLTSMIGCIDLLKQVEELPGEARDYVALLSKKAERLREMIQDVFDMAKATSGGQDLQMERLDMVRLIRQTLADMQDRIQDSGLHFRVKIEDKELFFLGDSKKMYRVYQNLIENVLKYSMPASRVYVEVKSQGEEIWTSIKNTSDREMAFSAEEIMERFTRGDKSRSTEGNGLGLAIAQSFTQACGGRFQVTLDGDLFKAETVFGADRTSAGAEF